MSTGSKASTLTRASRGTLPVLAIAGGFIAGGVWFPVGVGIAGAAAAGELFARARTAGLRPLVVLGLAGIVALAWVGHTRAERPSRALVGIVGALVIATLGGMLVRTDRRRVIETMLASLVPTVVVGVPVAFLVSMRGLDEGERLVGTLLLVVLFAELAGRATARLSGAGLGGTAQGFSRASVVRIFAAAVGATGGALIASTTFDPVLGSANALAIAAVGAVAVGIAPPVATLVEAIASPGDLSPATSAVRVTTGLWVAAPFAFYAFVVLAR